MAVSKKWQIALWAVVSLAGVGPVLYALVGEGLKLEGLIWCTALVFLAYCGLVSVTGRYDFWQDPDARAVYEQGNFWLLLVSLGIGFLVAGASLLAVVLYPVDMMFGWWK